MRSRLLPLPMYQGGEFSEQPQRLSSGRLRMDQNRGCRERGTAAARTELCKCTYVWVRVYWIAGVGVNVGVRVGFDEAPAYRVGQLPFGSVLGGGE